jgi:hypothetical protein
LRRSEPVLYNTCTTTAADTTHQGVSAIINQSMLKRVIITGIADYEEDKIDLIRIILDRHSNYNVNDLKAPSSVMNM